MSWASWPASTSKLYEWTFLRLQVLVVFMHNLLWIFHIAFNHTVWELASKWCCLLVFLTVAKTCCLIASAVNLRLVSAHVPLFVVGDVSWVCTDGSNDRDNQVKWEEHEESAIPQRLDSCLLDLVWVILPHLVKRYLWVVTSYCWVQIELREVIGINDEIGHVFLHMNSRQIDMCKGRKWPRQGSEKPTCRVGSRHAPSNVVPGSRSMTVLERQSYLVAGDFHRWHRRNFLRGFLFPLLSY